MKLKRDARSLEAKTICSLRRAVTAFNGYDDDGRVTTVVLHMQHASEMLLKAILVQHGVPVMDSIKNSSIGHGECVNIAIQHATLTSDEAGPLRVVNDWRNDEEHWIISVPENILYLHSRALVTIFDDLLKREFGDSLADHLPARVLPISTQPPMDFVMMIDREFSQICELLQPGKRQRDEARARVRTMLAMESHVTEREDIGESEINRMEKQTRGGRGRDEVFPGLDGLETHVAGSGATITVRFTEKAGEGAPVKFITADDPTEAAAVRDVDLNRRFHLSPTALADKLRLNTRKSFKLRKKLGHRR